MTCPSNTEQYERIYMPETGTPEWHELRRVSGCTASETAAILDLSKWQDKLAIYLLKRGLVAPDDGEDKPWLQWGNDVEPLLRARFEKQTGFKGSKPTWMARSKKCPWLCANLDWLSECGRIIADFKWSESEKDWGESYTQDVPLEYYFQIQHQLLVTQADVAYLFVRLPYHKFRIYEITADADVQAKIAEATCDFWENNVKAGVAPEGRTTDSVKKLFPKVTDAEVELDGSTADLVGAHRLLRDQLATIEIQKQQIEAKLLQAMGENRRASIPGWSGSITRSQSPDKQVPEKIIPAHVQKGRFTFRINHPRD